MNLPIFFALIFLHFPKINDQNDETLEKNYLSWNNPENHSFEYYIQSRSNYSDTKNLLLPLTFPKMQKNRSPAIDFSEEF